MKHFDLIDIEILTIFCKNLNLLRHFDLVVPKIFKNSDSFNIDNAFRAWGSGRHICIVIYRVRSRYIQLDVG
jgi:hypothetical protein